MAERSTATMETIRRHRFTVEDYHRMGEAGIFGPEDDRTELLDGEILVMGPVGARHANCVDRLNTALARLGDRAVLRVQSPVQIDGYSEPLPDLALLAPPLESYASRHPGPPDVLLLIEVADSTRIHDREQKLPRYARAGIREVWLVDLVEERIEVCREPAGDAYLRRRTAVRGERVAPAAFPELELAVDGALP